MNASSRMGCVHVMSRPKVTYISMPASYSPVVLVNSCCSAFNQYLQTNCAGLTAREHARVKKASAVHLSDVPEKERRFNPTFPHSIA